MNDQQPEPTEQPKPEPEARSGHLYLHVLKTWPKYFEEIISGKKTFEVRKDDRAFEVGDILDLREFIPCQKCNGDGRQWDNGDKIKCCEVPHGTYTGRKCKRVITSMLTAVERFGLQPGYAVMSIQPEPPPRSGHLYAAMESAVADEEITELTPALARQLRESQQKLATALAEIERLKSYILTGSDQQRNEIDRLAAENARLREALAQARIGMRDGRPIGSVAFDIETALGGGQPNQSLGN